MMEITYNNKMFKGSKDVKCKCDLKGTIINFWVDYSVMIYLIKIFTIFYIFAIIYMATFWQQFIRKTMEIM